MAQLSPRVWLPAAQLQPAPYQKTLANTFRAPEGTAELVEDDGFGIVTAKYPPGAKPVLTLTSRVSTGRPRSLARVTEVCRRPREQEVRSLASVTEVSRTFHRLGSGR